MDATLKTVEILNFRHFARHIEFTGDGVPVSLFASHPNLKYHTQNLPCYTCSSRVVKRFEVVSRNIKKFQTNFNGIIIEDIIYAMLDAEEVDSSDFLIQNKRKLKYIGKLPTPYDEIYMSYNSDGTVSAVDKKDIALANELNKFILLLKNEIEPLADYIKNSIFKKKRILSQELVVNLDKNVLALCDLSSDSAVLEIKAYGIDDLNKVSNQLFYESNGRNCYIMQIEWSLHQKKMAFVISKIKFETDDFLQVKLLKRNSANFKSRISNKQVDVVEYVNSYSQVTLTILQILNIRTGQIVAGLICWR